MASSSSPGLTYYFPKPGKPHTLLHVPGSHTLYVGPLSCSRRHAIHAWEYGDRRDVSFLFITQADVISGRYEELMVQGIGELLEVLDPVPHIFTLALFCIDDFLGTDEQALLDQLNATYPDCQFAIDHIDPVALSNTQHMGAKMHRGLYSFIKPASEHDRGINFVGNFVSLDPGCEFLALLKDWGCGPVRELFTCKDYQAYQDMGRSCLSIVMRVQAVENAASMEERLGIPYYTFTPGYDARSIAEGYGDVAQLLGHERPDFSDELALVASDVERTLEVLGDMPIAVDSGASLMCFAFAKALIEYGFNVRWVFRSNHGFKLDPEAEEYILTSCPHVLVTRAESYQCLYQGVGEGELSGEQTAKTEASTGADAHATEAASECLAIGAAAARVLRAPHFVDIWHDEGFFGFQGIHKLMALLRQAALTETDWSQVPELKREESRGEFPPQP